MRLKIVKNQAAKVIRQAASSKAAKVTLQVAKVILACQFR